MIKSMQKISILLSVDWAVITFRWVFLVGINLLLAMNVDFALFPVLLTIVLAAIWNIAATVLVIFKKTSSLFYVWSVVIDMSVAYLLYFFSDKLGGPAWVGLLPVLTAALYFPWWGTLVVILSTVLGQWLLAWPPNQANLPLLGMLLILYLVIGFPLAYVSQRLMGMERFSIKEILKESGEVGHLGHDRRRFIYELISELSSSLNYQRVLEGALDYGMSALSELGAPADQLSGIVLLFSQEKSKSPHLHVAASRRIFPSDTRVTLPGTSGLIGRVIEEGQYCLIDDVQNDPELSCFIGLHKCRSTYGYSLRSGLDMYGILLFAHPDKDFFSPDRQEVLDIIGHQSVIALQNARLYQDLAQEKERMLEILDESRKKLARDLHDGPTQSVAAIAMRVNFARRLLERDPKTAAEELFKIEDLARRTTKEIRHMLFTLRPLVLESQGLMAALQSMGEKMKETYSQSVIIQPDPRMIEALEAGKQAVVFYIAEEAVNNARKHAKAEHIWVRLQMLKDNLSLLEIEDDGVGFDVNSISSAYESRGSLGLVNMRERAELINGLLRIESVMGRGTRVQVVIPLTEEAADRIRHGG
jgi:signal transduction histidine kinase